KYFRARAAGVQLCADAIEFVFDIYCSRRRWRRAAVSDRSYIDEPFPDCFGGWFRTGEHAFDWAEERKLCPMKLVIFCQNRGASDVAQEHVRFLHLIERRIKRLGDCFLDQSFA